MIRKRGVESVTKCLQYWFYIFLFCTFCDDGSTGHGDLRREKKAIRDQNQVTLLSPLTLFLSPFFFSFLFCFSEHSGESLSDKAKVWSSAI
jgi:hypothetical protein